MSLKLKQITDLVQDKAKTITKVIKKAKTLDKKDILATKLNIKKIAISSIKHAQKDSSNFLLSPGALQRSKSKLYLSSMFSGKTQDDFSTALKAIMNQN